MLMKRILFLLLGLTIAVGASAGVDTWNQKHDAIMQKRHPASEQRFKSHNMQHKATKPTKLRGETPEANYEQPEGTLVTYKRSGGYLQRWNDPDAQFGHVMVVYDPDGTTVYVKGLACGVYDSGWVTGTIANGKITIPLGQYVWTYYEDGEYWYGLYLAWGSVEKNQDSDKFVFTPDPDVTAVTYTIDGDNITLDNSNGGDNGDGATGLVSFWDDEDDFYYFEWGTVFTPDEIAIPEIITEQPEGELVTYGRENYHLSSYNNPFYDFGEPIDVVYAPDGETVYIRDIIVNYYEYNTWVRGTISGGKIHVPLGQYIYFDLVGESAYLDWGSAAIAPDNDDDLWFTFTPDPTATEVTFTIDGDNLIMDNSTGDDSGDGATGLAMMEEYLDGETYFTMYYNTFLSPYVETTVIEDQPEGELVSYQRSGYYFSGNYRTQGGEVNIVYAPDGETVYIQDIICNSGFGSWVMGTIENGKIHVPMKQFIYWQDPKKQNNRGNGGWGYMLAFGQTYYNENYNEYMFNYDPSITEATFTINGNVISLDGTSFSPNDDMDGATGLVAVYSDYPTYFAQCDINTVFTIPPSVIDEQPEGELVSYSRSGYQVSWDGAVSQQDGTANIVYAPDGETVYIQDIIYNGPGTWVRGTISGGKIHVPTEQTIAILQQQDPVRAIPGNRGGTEYIVLTAGQVVEDPNYPGEYLLDYDPSVTEITFSINGDNISLDNTSFGPNDGVDGAMVIAASYLSAPQYFAICDLLTVFGEPQAVPTVIYDQPNGELVTYKRAGYGIWNYEELMKKASDSKYINEWINLSEQWGEANVVFAPDGETVYLQDPVYCNAQSYRGTWVRGTLSANGTKITVPLGQYVLWNDKSGYGEQLAWGSISVEPINPESPDDERNVIFTPDNSVTEVTYTITNGCLLMDNSNGPTAEEFYGLHEQYDSGSIDWETFQAGLEQMLHGTGLAYVNLSGDWTNEINWDTKYASLHPTMLPDPVIYSWHEAQNQWESTYLEVLKPEFDVDGLPIFEEALSYSIYTDNDQLFTFDASKYNIEEDMTEITYDTWYNHDMDLYIGYPTFEGTWSQETNSFVPFFNWRIGIQFHYTVDGVKNSTNIVYIEVYEKPEDPVMTGDANGDGTVSIGDVTSIIDALLSNDLDVLYRLNADVNNDGLITIGDVTALIDMLLSNSGGD